MVFHCFSRRKRLAANFNFINGIAPIVAAALLVASAISAAAAGTSKLRNGLPPCSTDSFVYEAAQYKDLIYGDEGSVGVPPYAEFTLPHRINTGIFGTRDEGLTTGHGSMMPSAWGHDEFEGAEWYESGTQGVVASDGMYDGGSFLTPDNPGNPARSKYNKALPSYYNQNENTGNTGATPAYLNKVLENEHSKMRWIEQPDGLWINNETGEVVNSNGLETNSDGTTQTPQKLNAASHKY